MAFVHWTGGVVLVAIGLASGFFLGRAFGSAAVPHSSSAGDGVDVSKGAAAAIHEKLPEAVHAKAGARQLELLAELAALGPEHYPEVVGHWIRIANPGPGALDAPGETR